MWPRRAPREGGESVEEGSEEVVVVVGGVGEEEVGRSRTKGM